MKALLALLLLSSLTRHGFGADVPATLSTTTRPVLESKPVLKGGLAVSVVLPREEAADDKQPQFIVRFKNIGEDYQNLYDVAAYWNWEILFYNTDLRITDGPGPWRLRMRAIKGRNALEHRQIKPGESADVTVNLNEPPFTFAYEYAGPRDHLIAPVRRLAAGHYRLTVAASLKLPEIFQGEAGRHEWVGPVTTDPLELTIAAPSPPIKPSTTQLAAYDAAIAKVCNALSPDGMWMNGVSPQLDLPPHADALDVIDAAVNQSTLDSKKYRVLRIQAFTRKDMPGMPGNVSGSAALLQVGNAYKVIILFPDGPNSWNRFYDTELSDLSIKPVVATDKSPQ